MADLLLFDVPATGTVTSKRKPASVDRIKVDHEIAEDRYYLHRRLKKFFPEWKLDAAKRSIDLPYQSFTDIPVGNGRYYVGQLLKLGYTVQYKII